MQKQHLPKYLQVIQTTQFLGEYFGSKQTEKRIYYFFLALEILKLLVKLRKWKLVDKWGLMISDTNNYGEVDNKEEEKAIEFKSKWGGLEYDPPATDPQQVKQMLSQLKEDGPKFNLSYYDTIADKNVALLTTLPIPEDFKKKDYESQLNRIRIKVGEVLHLIRPIIYCLFIIKFGSQSYTPYLASLFIDLLRYLIQLNVKLFRKSQQEELKIRTKEAIICYILRNPFYSEVFRKQVLDKILGLILKQDGWIYRIIISIIEIRSSKCLLL